MGSGGRPLASPDAMLYVSVPSWPPGGQANNTGSDQPPLGFVLAAAYSIPDQHPWALLDVTHLVTERQLSISSATPK